MSGPAPRGWAAPLYTAVLDAAAIGPGARVLDLGCGPGLFARCAADRGARVTGIDPDPVAVRMAARRVPEGSFSVGVAEVPPPGPFDVVAAVQLLPHVPDPVPVLGAAARAGTTVVATVWGRDRECDVRVLGEALSAWLPPRPRLQGRVLVTDPERLVAAAAEAGLAVERLEEVSCPFEYADEDELLGSVLDSGPGRAACRRAGPAAVCSALVRHLEPYRTPEGGFRLENLVRLLVARPA